MKKLLRPIPLAFFALAPLSAFAHPGHDGGHDVTWTFSAGFVHPFTGWDHLLAMIAVGLWAAQFAGRTRWLLPLTFAVAMSAGAAFGISAPLVTFTEQAIAASVFVLGLCVIVGGKAPPLAAALLVSIFAVFHGVAHRAEMPGDATAGAYIAGLVLATSCLQAVGLGLAFATAPSRQRLAYAAGCAIAVGGFAMLAH